MLALAACVAAAPAAAASRPGKPEIQIGQFDRDRVLSVDTEGAKRIVVAGISSGYPRNHGWVRAFLPDGRPDPSFGAGDGVLELGETRESVRALVLGDGRILTAQGGNQHEPEPLVIRRLNRDGSLDDTFGSGGSVQVEFGGASSGAYLSDLILDGAGRLIVVGGVGDRYTPPTRIGVRRYLPDGSRDGSYGGNGETALLAGAGSPAAARLTPDGGVLLAFNVDDYPTVAHLSPDGALDSSFPGGGSAPMQLAEPQWRANVRRARTGPRPVVLADGRIRVPVAFRMPHDPVFRIALVGLTAEGRPDLGYGFHGLALGPRPAGLGGEEPSVALADTTGSVIVAGTLWSGADFTFDDFAMIRRFRPDGSLDRSFGQGGLVPAALAGGGYTVFGQSLALLGPDMLVAGEYTFDGKYQFWGSTALRTLNAGYDRDDPSISAVVRGCRTVLVEIGDVSGVEAEARVNGRVVKRTTRKRFRVRARRGGSRVFVQVTDLAENSSTERVRLPRC